jgi:glutamine synthetase
MSADSMTHPAAAPYRALLMSIVDSAGIERSRLIPRDRIRAVLDNGAHASLSSVAMFTPSDEPVDAAGLDAVIGDLLVRPAEERLATVDESTRLAWAPADLLWPDGTPFFACGRHTVRCAVDALSALGLHALVGFEIEFTLTTEADLPAHSGPAYGQRPLVQNEVFATALLEALATAGVPVLQLHAEHGLGQFEIALAARDPLDACDDDLLARFVIERTSVRHGLTVHFEPIPPVGAASNGMHIHLSLLRGEENLMTPVAEDAPGREGAAVIAGILAALPAATALLAGSEAGYERLRPGRWSGASLCWGVGNREAAVRYVPATATAGARGANIEVKPGDATANPYFAVAALLSAASDGLIRDAVPPAPIEISPARLSEQERAARGIRSLPSTLVEALRLLDGSELLRHQLGDRLIDLYLAVRMPRP